MNDVFDTSALPTSPGRPVFAIFQGGGADGVAHLGAIAAVEEEGLEMIGVAGASAGAFVAALVAAGYRGTELFNPQTKGSDLLSRYGKQPLELLGKTDWDELGRARAFIRLLPDRLGLRGSRWNIFSRTADLYRLWSFWKESRPHRDMLARSFRELGHFDAGEVREFVNWAVREKLLDAYASSGKNIADVPARVTFAHLDTTRFPQFRPLKIVATDVSARKAELFSQNNNSDVEIGLAVAASISIPGAFKPVQIPELPGRLFADGGLVSNLPAWTFLEDKLAYERRFPDEDRVPILAFTLTDPTKATPSSKVEAGGDTPNWLGNYSRVPSYASDVIRAGIVGSQAIGQSLISDVIAIELRPALGILGFDAEWKAILEAVNAGRRGASSTFANSLRLRPERVRAELSNAVQGVRKRLPATSRQGDAGEIRIRAFLAVPAGSRSLRIVATYGAETEADDNLLLDREGPGCAKAFRDRAMTLVEVAHDSAGRPILNGHASYNGAARMTRYEAALLWRDLKSFVCVPIFAEASELSLSPDKRKSDPLGMLVIDSNGELGPAMDSQELLAWLAERSVILSSLLVKGFW